MLKFIQKIKTMRRQSFLFKVAAFLILAGFMGTSGTTDVSAGNDSAQIIIIPRSDEISGAPRTPVYNPFFAQVEDYTIWLGCSSSYGSVDVELVSTAGDYSLTVFDTDDGLIMIPISGDSGHYTLTLTSESGMTFVGEFDL